MLSIWLLCYGNILLQFICRMFLPPPLGYLFGVSSKQVFKTHLETRSGVDSVWSAKNEMNGMRYNYTNTHSHTMLYVVDPHSTKKVMTLRKSNRAHKLNKSWNYNVKICINCSIHLLSLPLCQILCRTPFSQFCWNFIKFVQFSLFFSLSLSRSPPKLISFLSKWILIEDENENGSSLFHIKLHMPPSQMLHLVFKS